MIPVFAHTALDHLIVHGVLRVRVGTGACTVGAAEVVVVGILRVLGQFVLKTYINKKGVVEWIQTVMGSIKKTL